MTTEHHIPTPAQAIIIEACHELILRAEKATGAEPQAIFASPDIMATVEWTPGHEAKVNGIPLVCDYKLGKAVSMAI